MTDSSQATQALEAPPAAIDPQTEFNSLRAWIAEHCLDANAVRRSAYQMAMSAMAHRLLKFGPDESLNSLTCRDLMCLLMYCNGELAEYLMRVAYFRSIIEGEHAIYERFNQTLFIGECRAWYWTIAEAMFGGAPDAATVTSWVESMAGEEKTVARLIIARVFPDIAHIDWLGDVPNSPAPQHGRLGAELCLILLEKPEYLPLVKNYLRAHPHVRYAIDDQRWPRL